LHCDNQGNERRDVYDAKSNKTYRLYDEAMAAQEQDANTVLLRLKNF